MAVEDEALHVGRHVRVALVPPSARHLDEHESVTGLLVRLGETATDLVDDGRRLLEQLGEHVGRHRLGRHQDDGLECLHQAGVERRGTGRRCGAGIGLTVGGRLDGRVVRERVVIGAVVRHLRRQPS